MRFRNFVNEKIVLPLSYIVLGQSIYKHLNFLSSSQWWSESKIIDYQNGKLCAEFAENGCNLVQSNYSDQVQIKIFSKIMTFNEK